jgi:transposase
MCPGNEESAGKRRSAKTRKGSKWLRSALTESARAAARSKGTYLASHYARLRGRRGSKKAAVAVGHSILVICYHVLERGCPMRSSARITSSSKDPGRRTRSDWSASWSDSVTR